ncbi:AbrB/MazE/SpoVT family DNA-binding domain-containing protein [Methylopila henanensis]|uniref:AbrB/MazE/SpoVT family DNA-binding domain-containing protein n=1 Tax=Methylopila henanensis TaxID=873516 RepID=A0ABW4K1T5_9HYPH
MGRFDAKTSLKGQATIPVEVRRALGLEPGGSVQFLVGSDGDVRVIAKTRTMRHLKGIFGPLDAPLDVDDAIARTVQSKTILDADD